MSEKRPGLNEMIRYVDKAAERIYRVQCARKKAGFEPDADELRMVKALDAAGDLLERIIPVVGDVSKIVQQVSIEPYRREEL